MEGHHIQKNLELSPYNLIPFQLLNGFSRFLLGLFYLAEIARAEKGFKNGPTCLSLTTSSSLFSHHVSSLNNPQMRHGDLRMLMLFFFFSNIFPLSTVNFM